MTRKEGHQVGKFFWHESLVVFAGRVAAEAQAKAINDEAVKALDAYRARIVELVPEKPLNDLEKMQADPRAELAATDSEIKKKKAGKRLKLIEAFLQARDGRS